MTKVAEPIAEASLADFGLLERANLQAWVESYPEMLGSDLIVITTELDQWEARRRVSTDVNTDEMSTDLLHHVPGLDYARHPPDPSHPSLGKGDHPRCVATEWSAAPPDHVQSHALRSAGRVRSLIELQLAPSGNPS